MSLQFLVAESTGEDFFWSSKLDSLRSVSSFLNTFEADVAAIYEVPLLFFRNRIAVRITKNKTYACDKLCDRSYGRSSRPQVQYSDNPDDWAWLADHEIPEKATEEGKPRGMSQYLDAAACRDCERKVSVDSALDLVNIQLPDFSRRVANIPGRQSLINADLVRQDQTPSSLSPETA